MQLPPLNIYSWKWLFIIVIIVELYYMYNFTEAYGFFSLMALILGSMIFGVVLMRWEGSICWARILYMQQHNKPTIDEMRDGVLILFAGVLMIIPGVITDVLGLALFLPPIRWIVRKLFLQNLYFEAPQGMESHFRMYSFMNSNAPNGSQNFPDDNSEDNPDDAIDSPYERTNRSDKDVQIIDVVAADPNKAPDATSGDEKKIESEQKEDCEPDAKNEK